MLARRPQPDDWRRFDLYASKIQHYRHNAAEPHSIPYSTYVAVDRLHGTPLFPNLRALSSVPGVHGPVLALLGASPNLRRLQLPGENSGTEEPINNILACIPAVSGRLQTLVLHGQASEEVLELIAQMKGLSQLELQQVDSLSADSLELLGGMVELTQLTLKPNFNTLPVIAAGTMGFPKLRGLNITASGLEGVTRLLDHISSTSLESVTVTYSPSSSRRNPADSSEVEIISRCLRVISRKWKRSLIQVMLIHTTTTGATSPPPRGVDTTLRDLLDPLFDSNLLERLRIVLPSIVQPMTEAELGDLAGHLPKLTHLGLPAFNILPFTSLQVLAERCPRLLYLGVSLDTTSLPQSILDVPALFHGLEKLSVGNSVCSSGNLVFLTRCLYRVFPHLNSIPSTRSCRPPWALIEEQLQLCRDAHSDDVDRGMGRRVGNRY